MGFQDQLSLNAGQKYCKMLKSIAKLSNKLMREHKIMVQKSAILPINTYTYFWLANGVI